MPFGGLALAVSVSTALEVTTLFLLMRVRLAGIQGARIGRGFLAAGLGTAGLAVALVFWLRAVGSAPVALTALGGVAAGGLIYALILVLLRIQEVADLFRMLKRRLQR